ncbi:MAG TPA: MFS transporter [Spirochaetia bacterium]|nr:MFS transporter [Spirochaetia bacterium]
MKLSGLRVIRLYSELPREIHVLFFARLVNSMGAFVFPFLTLYLTQKMGLSTATAGLYMLLVAAAHVPGAILGGKLTDRIGRKKVLVFGQAMAGAFLLPGAVLGTSILVPWSIFAAQFFAALAQPSNQAMATDLTNRSNRQAAFSLLYLGYNLGFAVGPLLAGFLFTNLTWLLFLGDAFTTFVSVGMVALLVPDSTPSADDVSRVDRMPAMERPEKGHTLVALRARPVLLIFALLVSVLTFVYSQYGFALPLRLKELFLERGPVFYGTLMTMNAIVVIVLTAPVVLVTRRFSPARNLSHAALCYVVGFGMIYFLRTFPVFFVSTAIWTLGEILVSTNSNVYIANHTPVSHRGRFNALFPLITGGGRALSPPVIGRFILWFGLSAVWPVLAALAALAGIGLLVLARRDPPGSDAPSGNDRPVS